MKSYYDYDMKTVTSGAASRDFAYCASHQNVYPFNVQVCIFTYQVREAIKLTLKML